LNGSLSGLRVVECARHVAGPFAGKLLADLGAEVIKVEEPGRGDPCRHLEPFVDDLPGPDRSGLFLYLNTSKMGITLDLSTATGGQILRHLLEDADVLIEDYAPGQTNEWGLGFTTLHRENPRLVVLSITPFGQTGPHCNYKGDNLIASHAGGVAHYTPTSLEDLSFPPLKAGGRQGDFLTGVIAATVVMIAIIQRQRSGIGSHVDLSRQEALAYAVIRDMVAYAYAGTLTPRGGPMVAGISGLLKCKNGYAHLHAREERLWPSLLEIMGNPDWAEDPRFADVVARDEHWDELWPHIQEWAAQQTKEEIAQCAQERHIACAAVNSISEVVQSPHLAAREFFLNVDHPVIGSISMPSAPFKVEPGLWAVRRRAPTLGEHNEEILCGRMGYSLDDMARLAGAGII